MKDEVKALTEHGINAGHLDSDSAHDCERNRREWWIQCFVYEPRNADKERERKIFK